MLGCIYWIWADVQAHVRFLMKKRLHAQVTLSNVSSYLYYKGNLPCMAAQSHAGVKNISCKMYLAQKTGWQVGHLQVLLGN